MSRRDPPFRVKHRWRFYRTETGGEVVREELRGFGTDPRAAVVETMKRCEDRKQFPREVARVTREILELRVTFEGREYRVLYSEEGSKGRVLLALRAFEKKTKKLPKKLLRVAERRLADWRRRAPER